MHTVPGIAALVVDDARQALEWADLIYAMDLKRNEFQRYAPQHGGAEGAAIQVAELGSRPRTRHDQGQLFVQATIRTGSFRTRRACGLLPSAKHRRGKTGALCAMPWFCTMNSSDHNPAVRTDLSPQDSWELSTPQLMKFYVKGGKHSNGKHGYIVSNANWDPFPMANKLEDFVIALANMDIAVSLRIDRFQQSVLHGGRSGDRAAYSAGQRFRGLSGRGRRLHPRWICSRRSRA